MKSYILTGPYKLQKENKEIPEPEENEVLIKISNVGICGSDIHLYNGTYNGPNNYPILFGHEWSGIVVKTGKSVKKVSTGDKVTGDCSKYCGKCDNCKEDRNLCKYIEKFGITTDGASAEYIIRDEKYIYKAPQDIDLSLLALTEPISVARHLLEKILRQTGNFTDKRILIYGGGAIGQAALILMKREYGCREVYLQDLILYRMQLAERLGALKPDEKELSWDCDNSYYNMYNKTPFDIVIETTGVGKVFSSAFNLLRPGGVLGCVGMIGKVEIEQKLIVTKALSIIGSIGGTEEFEKTISFINENQEAVSCLISHKYAARDVQKAFETAVDPKSALKVSIIF